MRLGRLGFFCRRVLDSHDWFDAPLKKDLEVGRLTHARLSDMVRRILRSLYAVGADEPSAPGPIDTAAHNQVALESERQGIVLLKNDGVLPLQSTLHSVAPGVSSATVAQRPSPNCRRSFRMRGEGADYRQLLGGRRCRLPLVRQAKPGTVVSIWLRTQLHPHQKR